MAQPGYDLPYYGLPPEYNSNAPAVYDEVLMAAKASITNEFVGTYTDQNHPGCTRILTAPTANLVAISGTDGASGGGCDGSTDTKWGPLDGFVTGYTMTIDFSPKGGPADLTGYWSSGTKGIKWADGNFWTM